jgi:exodeoxyribonuclease V beta subunit
MTKEYLFSRPAPRTELGQPRVWALEASAGTGKTWNIENFVADYLADGTVSPSEVVVVTFTRAAAAELRSRIRRNLVAIAEGRFPNGTSFSTEERDCIRRAINSFGELRISTIHGFAQRTLQQMNVDLGELSDTSQSRDYIRSVVRDVVRSLPQDDLERLATLSLHPEGDEFKWFDKLVSLLNIASNHPDAEFISSQQSAALQADWQFFLDVANRCREEFRNRKAKLGHVDFSDLVSLLRDRLFDKEFARTVGSTFRVLLIDEFQDTDALQWQIFDSILDNQKPNQMVAMVVVGDPKQAIYSFRGGDVQVYREVVKPGTYETISGNRRSTKSFVEGANRFFNDLSDEEAAEAISDPKYYRFGATFSPQNEEAGFEVPPGYIVENTDIPYSDVRATGHLADVEYQPAGWRFRELEVTSSDALDKALWRDLPEYISRLVKDELIPDPQTGAPRPIRYDDICVLSASNKDIKKYAAMLERRGIPASIVGTTSVLDTSAALQWRYVLEAIRSPSRTSSARLLAQSWFGGERISDLIDNRNDPVWIQKKSQQLIEWHALFASGKRDQFFDAVVTESNVLSFLAKYQSGDRNITDLTHVAEVLRLRQFDSLNEMIDMLQSAELSSKEDDGEDADSPSSTLIRRIEGDQAAVRLMTIHASKGLQFPVVLVPKFTQSPNLSSGEIAYRVKTGSLTKTVIDASATSKTPGSNVKSVLGYSERNRLAYVAFTRAQVMNVLWTWKYRRLRPILRNYDGREWLSKQRVVEDTDHNPYFLWDDQPGSTPDKPSHPPAIFKTPVALRSEVPGALSSFTSFSRFLQTSEVPADGEQSDFEPEDTEGSSAILTPSLNTPSRSMYEAALLGKAIHRVLQNGVPDVTDEQFIMSSIRDAADEFGLYLDSTSDILSEAMQMVINALTGDLSQLEPGARLADLQASRQQNEVSFSFALPHAVTAKQIIDVIKEHESENPDFGHWLQQTTGKDIPVRGVLTGSIDTVLATEDDDPRFYIADYKTNRLPDGTDRYGREAMLRSMGHKHYHLQALIYLVALHRWLQARLGSTYNYETHVGGAAYLYLRGMNPTNPNSGVVVLRPSRACIEALSELFERGMP